MLRKYAHFKKDIESGVLEPKRGRTTLGDLLSYSEADIDLMDEAFPVMGPMEKFLRFPPQVFTTPHLDTEVERPVTVDKNSNELGLTVVWDRNFKCHNTFKTNITMKNNPFLKWSRFDK